MPRLTDVELLARIEELYIKNPKIGLRGLRDAGLTGGQDRLIMLLEHVRTGGTLSTWPGLLKAGKAGSVVSMELDVAPDLPTRTTSSAWRHLQIVRVRQKPLNSDDQLDVCVHTLSALRETLAGESYVTAPTMGKAPREASDLERGQLLVKVVETIAKIEALRATIDQRAGLWMREVLTRLAILLTELEASGVLQPGNARAALDRFNAGLGKQEPLELNP